MLPVDRELNRRNQNMPRIKLLSSLAVAFLSLTALAQASEVVVGTSLTDVVNVQKYYRAIHIMAMLLLGLLHQYVDRNDRVSTDARPFLLAKTFSRYAFTIYVLHQIVHLYPLWIYGYAMGNEPTAFWQKAMPVTISIPLAVVFLACCYAILSRLNPDRRYGIEGWMRWLCD
jgi:hypothetical protein